MVTVKEKYGFLPASVWYIGKGSLKGVITDISKARDITKARREKASEFNPELARRVIKYWSDEGDLILDPFAGRSTRMETAKILGRDYIGFEIAPLTFELLKEKIKVDQTVLLGKLGKVNVLNKDGCKLERIPDNFVDLIFTCPPYWNIERYESCEGQLSDIVLYDGFLDKIDQCIKRCYEVLKQDKFAIFVVQDFRIKGQVYSLHNDTINLFLKNGFVLWDVVINVLFSNTVQGIGIFEPLKFTAKIHEYILVFKKPQKGFEEPIYDTITRNDELRKIGLL